MSSSEETRVLLAFVDRCLSLMSPPKANEDPEFEGAEIIAVRLVGHAFQLITGLMVNQSKTGYAHLICWASLSLSLRVCVGVSLFSEALPNHIHGSFTTSRLGLRR